MKYGSRRRAYWLGSRRGTLRRRGPSLALHAVCYSGREARYLSRVDFRASRGLSFVRPAAVALRNAQALAVGVEAPTVVRAPDGGRRASVRTREGERARGRREREIKREKRGEEERGGGGEKESRRDITGINRHTYFAYTQIETGNIQRSGSKLAERQSEAR